MFGILMSEAAFNGAAALRFVRRALIAVPMSRVPPL